MYLSDRKNFHFPNVLSEGSVWTDLPGVLGQEKEMECNQLKCVRKGEGAPLQRGKTEEKH